MLLPRVVVLDHNVMIDRWPKTEWGNKYFVFPDKHRGLYSRVYYHDIRRWHYHRRSNGFLTGWANLWSGCHGNAGFIKISVSKKKKTTLQSMTCLLSLLFVFYFVIDFEMKCIIYKFIFTVSRIYMNYHFFGI